MPVMAVVSSFVEELPSPPGLHARQNPIATTKAKRAADLNHGPPSASGGAAVLPAADAVISSIRLFRHQDFSTMKFGTAAN
ncbi:MAG: hypothetical protein LQ348_002212 [Seirophora lacunosa]|nr:MAG: hypothetical protein LQ348_002212 [Seirophora lacunosa]